jgi:hypothetical protein
MCDQFGRVDEHDVSNNRLTYFSTERIARILTRDDFESMEHDTTKRKGVDIAVIWDIKFDKELDSKLIYTTIFINEIALRVEGSFVLSEIRFFRGKKGVPIVCFGDVFVELSSTAHDVLLTNTFKPFKKLKLNKLIHVAQMHFLHVYQYRWFTV